MRVPKTRTRGDTLTNQEKSQGAKVEKFSESDMPFNKTYLLSKVILKGDTQVIFPEIAFKVLIVFKTVERMEFFLFKFQEIVDFRGSDKKTCLVEAVFQGPTVCLKYRLHNPKWQDQWGILSWKAFEIKKKKKEG